ncbi:MULTISPECIES: GIY-YIG nuclease family protein [unclassified Bradyrhizobium]
MTRRLEPMDRIHQLSDASVPFNFDAHALFFSKDALGIEFAMRDRLSSARVNAINQRREYFHVTAADAKYHLTGWPASSCSLMRPQKHWNIARPSRLCRMPAGELPASMPRSG